MNKQVDDGSRKNYPNNFNYFPCQTKNVSKLKLYFTQSCFFEIIFFSKSLFFCVLCKCLLQSSFNQVNRGRKINQLLVMKLMKIEDEPLHLPLLKILLLAIEVSADLTILRCYFCLVILTIQVRSLVLFSEMLWLIYFRGKCYKLHIFFMPVLSRQVRKKKFRKGPVSRRVPSCFVFAVWW